MGIKSCPFLANYFLKLVIFMLSFIMKVIPKVIPNGKTPTKTEGFERLKGTQVRILVPRHCKSSDYDESCNRFFYLCKYCASGKYIQMTKCNDG